jgi:putative ABC transport system substrate-binding protein
MGIATIRPSPKLTVPATPADPAPVAATRAFLLRCFAFGAVLALPVRGALAQAAGADVVRVHNLGGDPIGVLFPDLGEPFRKVFVEIISGIEGQARQRVRAYPISPNQNLQELAAVLKRNGTRVLVALGRQGLKAAASVDVPMVVVGGVSSVPEGEKQFGICLTPDPALLFAQLKTLLPSTRRVNVIYNPQHNDWLIRLAREAARGQGLELVAREARDLAAAARLYEATLANADGKRDALWLPIDPTTVDEATIMPIVLRDSWDHGVPVFSSSFLHVNKGVLFSLYPNNTELGRALANLAGDLLAGGAPVRGVTPLRDVHAALNTRTANHFGITIDARMQRAFHYLYPPA